MTVKKIYTALCFIFLMIITTSLLTSCKTDNTDNGKLKVVGTVFPQYDFAHEIGKERISCEMLMTPGTDSHGYTGDNPSDILKIQRCDLFIYVGGETDSDWVEKIITEIKNSGETPPVTLALTDVCSLIEESDAGILEKEHEEHNHETEYDDHVWNSPKRCIEAVNAIKDALCEIDPEGCELYTENAKSYTEKLSKLDFDLEKLFEDNDIDTLVFADRFPFAYFANDYSLNCFAAFNGCASQSEPSPTTIVKLCNTIKEKNLKYFFYTETSQSEVPSVIEHATGAEALMLHSCHTVTEKELKNGVTFIELWQKNYDTLEKAFKHE